MLQLENGHVWIGQGDGIISIWNNVLFESFLNRTLSCLTNLKLCLFFDEFSTTKSKN